MKTENILSTLRNATSPAARLAKWQNRNLANRRRMVAEYYDETADTAQRRAALIASTGPELSSPEAESPLLWANEQGPEILETYAGRDCGLDHRGWYSDDCQDETLETYAVRLARFPHLLFYAVKDSCSGDLRVNLSEWEEIDFSAVGSDGQAEDAVKDSARQLVRSYDSATQREAEESQEFYRKDRAEQDIAENKETLAALRQEIAALAHELRQPGNRANPETPILLAARKQLCAFLRDRRDLMTENETLAASL